MGICGIILISTSLLLGFLFIQGAGLASRNLGHPPKIVHKDINTAGALFLIWLLVVCGLGASQVLTDFTTMPPRFMIFLLLTFVATTVLAFSRIGKTLAYGLPITYLVGFQSFRILAELALFAAYKEGLAPVQMTFLGMNHDIITGASAVLLAFVLKKNVSRRIVQAWNVLGLFLLLKIVTIAVLSAPTPFRHFMEAPANTFVAQMPYILLPGILVASAFLGHLLVFRWLWKKVEKPS